MCCSSLSRSAAGNVRIASSISRAVLINAYDRAGDRAGKGDQHAGPPRTIPVSAISLLQSAVLFLITSNMRFHFETSKRGRGGRRYLPYAFTEQGVAMLSSVLRSSRAVQVNIAIMRTFVRLREMLLSNTELARMNFRMISSAILLRSLPIGF